MSWVDCEDVDCGDIKISVTKILLISNSNSMNFPGLDLHCMSCVVNASNCKCSTVSVENERSVKTFLHLPENTKTLMEFQDNVYL